MKYATLLIITIFSFINAQAQQPFYGVTAGDGNGVRFWNSDSYKIHMGNTSLYHYGPVTGYSIKMNMNSTSGWGWTWGRVGQAPIAALTNTGTMQLAGDFYAMGNVGIGTTNPLNLLDLIIPTGYQYGKGISIRRGDGYLKFQNGTGDGSTFSPNITGKATTSWVSSGLYIKGIPTNDQTDYVGITLISGESAPLVNADVLKIKNYTTDLMTVKSNGNVGIGLTNPNAPLHIRKSQSGWLQEIAGTAPNQGDFVGLKVLSGYAGETSKWVGISAIAESLHSNQTGLGLYTGLNERLRIAHNGNVGIGTTTPDAKLAVNGTIHTKEVKVDLIGWSDYVFDEDYNLPTLEEVKQHIDEKGHLPNIPSAAEVAENGINLGEMNAKLLEKIEELTLYLIKQNSLLEEQQKTNAAQNLRIEQLENN
jgi:hypothetical protein